MHQLSLKKYRRKDDVLDDASAVWEVEQIPGVQLAREFRSTCGPNRIAWRIFSSPRLAVRSHPGLRAGAMLSIEEQEAIALIESLRNKTFFTRREAIQALEVEVFRMRINGGDAE